MGRRALPKLDSRVDVTGWLVPLDQAPPPWDVAALFGRSADLEIEVGSGKGLFLLNASQLAHETNFLGVELSAKYARYAAYRLAQQSRINARVVQGDGLALFREYLGDQIAAAVHVYFPDPWWKARHRKRRVMQESFVIDVYRVLKPGGTLHFWTDVEEYFDTTRDLIGGVLPEFRFRQASESAAEHDMDYRTHFERRMRRHEHPVFRAQFVKPAN
jgi:tRNA (guanine-N7-)-methyltransferase